MAKRIHYYVFDVVEGVTALDDATRQEVTDLTGCKAPDRAIGRQVPFNNRWVIEEADVERGEIFWETWKKDWAAEWDKARYRLKRKEVACDG